MNRKVNLADYDNSWYTPGRNGIIRALWYCTSIVFFKSSLAPMYGLKRMLLRCFGAKVGSNVIIKPSVNIKYPWLLSIGDHTWIGEGVWIDNLCEVSIGNDCCISQGSMLLCGNHDYTKESFDLQVSPIKIEDCSWIGAKAIVCPGVTIGAGSVLTVGSVATKDVYPNHVYQGNPASEKKKI